MKVTFSIRRFDPEKNNESYMQQYDVEVRPEERVLDVLMHIKRTIDGSLGFRKSCAHGVCGSDAMLINGIERLACKTLIRDIIENNAGTITVEPLKHLPIQRDLMVDQDEFFKRYRDVKPFLVSREPAKEKEYVQTPQEREKMDDPTKCILCSACYSVCPILDEKNPQFVGPAAIVNAARFVFDSRDQGLAPRREVLDSPNGVWACENHFECTKVCPRGIKITKNINFTKKRIKQEEAHN